MGESRAPVPRTGFVSFAAVKLAEKMGAEDDGAAPAAGPSGVDILLFRIENKTAAVLQFSAQAQALPAGQAQQGFLAHGPQVPGENASKWSALTFRSRKWAWYCCQGRRGPWRRPVGCIFNAQIRHCADCCSSNAGAFPVGADQRRPRSR